MSEHFTAGPPLQPRWLRVARFIRHSRPLAKADSLWNRVRPIWQSAVALAWRSGCPVSLPGLGKVRLPVSFLAQGLDPLELPALASFHRELRSDTVFYDVGASIGLYSLVAKEVIGIRGEIHAFEPDDVSLSLYARHIREVRAACRVRCNRCFLSNRDSAQASDLPSEGISRSKAAGKLHHLYLFKPEDTLGIPEIRLDSYAQAIGRPPSLIKIDVEGAEFLVLKGAREALTRHRPRLFLSLHPHLIGHFGHSVEDVYTLLREARYAWREVSTEGETHVQGWPCD